MSTSRFEQLDQTTKKTAVSRMLTADLGFDVKYEEIVSVTIKREQEGQDNDGDMYSFHLTENRKTMLTRGQIKTMLDWILVEIEDSQDEGAEIDLIIVNHIKEFRAGTAIAIAKSYKLPIEKVYKSAWILAKQGIIKISASGVYFPAKAA